MTPQADEPTPLDAQALARLRELDPDGRHGVLTRVLQAFDTSLARMIVQLQAQSEAGDPQVVAAIAHTLKSSSASVGALALSQACAEVEARWRGVGGSGAPPDDSSPITGLRHDIHRLVALAEAAQRSAQAILHV
jgi:HPt (histidine-containing phosphotransfer) domain-containing protein